MQKTDKYNLSWSQRMMIITSSALHDIGKVGIEEKIINKTEKLTEEESNEMKMHTLIGAGMNRNLDEYKDEELTQIAYGICRDIMKDMMAKDILTDLKEMIYL